MISPKLIAALAGVGLFGASYAQISAFSLSPSAAQQNSTAGTVKSIDTTYNAATQSLTWSSTFTSNNGVLPEAFWLVVNNGPEPKGEAGQYAIFYFDGTSSSSPKLTVYGYNGVNGDSSYYDGSKNTGTQTPDRIASSLTSNFATNLKVVNSGNTRTLSFTADVKGINAYKPVNKGTEAWEGAQFGSKVGIWFHPLANVDTTYNTAGFLKDLSYSKSGWVDLTDQKTKPVPEPASLAALGVGAAALLRRRKKSAK